MRAFFGTALITTVVTVAFILQSTSVAVADSHVISTAGKTVSYADFKAYYQRQHETFIKLIPEDGGQAIAEYRYIGGDMPTRYDWWDLKTRKVYPLPTLSDFVRLIGATGGTEVKFVTTGRNDIDPSLAFPTYIDCTRPNATSQFTSQYEPDYLPITQSVTFGNKAPSAISDVRMTIQGIQFSYVKPRGVNLTGAYIPLIETSFDAKTHDMTIRMKKKVYWSGSLRGNYFIHSETMKRIGLDTIVTLHLTAHALHYSAHGWTLAGNGFQPYLSLAFASNDIAMNVTQLGFPN